MNKGSHCLTGKAANGICVSLIFFVFSSCIWGGKDKSSAKNAATSDNPVYSDTTRLKQIIVPGNFVYSAVLDDLDKSKLQSIDLALKIFCNNKADSLSRDSMLVSFNEFMTSVMQEYYDTKLLGNKELTEHFGNREDQTESQKLTKALAIHGIQLFYRDGEFYLEQDLSFVSEKINKALSTASREYLATKIQLNANQNLSVPDSIANQVVAWEDFQSKYPGYVMKEDIQAQYLDAIAAYLSGVEQMPLFDPNTKILHAKYHASYLRYIESYPNRESTKIVRKFYDLLTKKGYKYDGEIDTFLSEENLIPTPKTE